MGKGRKLKSLKSQNMGRINPLADALKCILVAERKGRRQVLLRPASKVIIKFLRQMQKHGYIGEFEVVDDHRSNKIVVELLGRINKCGVISPRFDIKLPNLEGWCSNILPSRHFGKVILTTTYGILDQHECINKKTGGKILGFFY